jgi:hypothetical protein
MNYRDSFTSNFHIWHDTVDIEYTRICESSIVSKSKGEIREEFKRNATSTDYLNDRSVYDPHYNKIHKKSLNIPYELK